jgi:hypothetical protein
MIVPTPGGKINRVGVTLAELMPSRRSKRLRAIGKTGT